jgi:hypothetical protein
LIKYIKAPMSWGLNPICISKMSIGKNYMWISVVGYGVSNTCNVNEENVTKRTHKTKIIRNLTTDRCLTVRKILV